MNVNLDIANILMMGVSALMGLFLQNLRAELARIEKQSEARTKESEARTAEKLMAVERTQSERRDSNQQRWASFERALENMTGQIDKLQGILVKEIGEIKIKVVQDHLTDVTARNLRLDKIDAELNQLLNREALGHSPPPGRRRQG